jgi:hypothetical protein
MDRDVSDDITSRFPIVLGWKLLLVTAYRVDENLMALRPVIIVCFSNPRRNPLPLLELLLIFDEPKGHWEEPHQLTVQAHTSNARRFDVLRAWRRISLTKDQNTSVESDHV